MFVEDLFHKLPVEGGLWEVSMEGMFVALVVVKLTERVQKIKRTFYCFGTTLDHIFTFGWRVLTFLWKKQ